MTNKQRISKTVECISYHTKLPILWQLNVLLYILAYVGVSAAYIATDHTLLMFVAFIALVFTHILSFLFTHWSVDFRTFVAYKKVIPLLFYTQLMRL